MPAPCRSCRARSSHCRCSGFAVGNVISPSNCMCGIFIAARARSSAACGLCTPLRPKPVSHSIRKRISTPWRLPASDRPFATVSLSSTTAMRLRRLDQRRQPLGLGIAEDVVGEQDVVGDAGLGHDLDLAELLARDADRAGLHLQRGERWDLVGLDVRTIGDTVPSKKLLGALDIGSRRCRDR